MESTSFYKIGSFIYRYSKWIIAAWLIAVICCMPFLKNIATSFQSTGFIAENSQSALADEFLNKHLDIRKDRVMVLYHSNILSVDASSFHKKIKQSLKKLKQFPVPHEVIYPERNPHQQSKNKHAAYALIIFKPKNHQNQSLNQDEIKLLKSLIKKPKNMQMWLGGESVFVDNINQQTQKDLIKADLIAAPLSIVILIVIFGSLVAAFVPLLLGGGCAILILTLLYALSQLMQLSVFTLNIALLLGLCLSLDYALFIISRFRDELKHHEHHLKAVAVTIGTAGKAVFFSGMTVFVSLSALLFFPVNILCSIGIGGLVAVFVSVAAAVTLLPAILSLLDYRINSFPVRKESMAESVDNLRNIWYRMATIVVKKPLIFFSLVLAMLLFLSAPVRQIVLGISNNEILPKHSSTQQFITSYKKYFAAESLNPIEIVAETKQGKLLTKKHIANLYDYVKKIKQLSSVSEVVSIVNINNIITRSQYQVLYTSPTLIKDDNIKQFLRLTTRKNFTVIQVMSKYPADSKETKKLIQKLNHMKPRGDWKISLTGSPVINADVLDIIKQRVPYVLAWVMVVTYLILMWLLRSLFLPFKAIFMNILSLCASYGVLVYIFQEGNYHTWLNFTPPEMLDVSLVVIIFCALFGFSMDYEIFLLSRIKEAYQESQDNDQSIVFGIVKSSRIITSAAIIVIFICASFMVADVLMVKEFGLGIAVAIFVDAFAIRTLLVPSTMAMVRSWNWYFPKCLKKI